MDEKCFGFYEYSYLYYSMIYKFCNKLFTNFYKL